MILPRGVTWPPVITDVAQLPVAYTKRESRRDQVTFGSHVTTTKKKARKKAGLALNLLPVRATSGQGLFQSRDFVTSGQEALLRRIWRNFRLRMRRTYFRTGHVTDVTFGLVTDVTSRCSPLLSLKCDFVRAHILLICIEGYNKLISQTSDSG
jgi:hypothetical protein